MHIASQPTWKHIQINFLLVRRALSLLLCGTIPSNRGIVFHQDLQGQLYFYHHHIAISSLFS